MQFLGVVSKMKQQFLKCDGIGRNIAGLYGMNEEIERRSVMTFIVENLCNVIKR